MRTLIVGAGFIGREVATALHARGEHAVLASRRPPGDLRRGTGWIPLDATDRAACSEAVRRTDPDAVVLVHGPSDVTWCQEHPERALSLHTTVAGNAVATAHGRKLVLISSDNVFDGNSPENDESAAVAPANAYGAAKLGAELLIGEIAGATVLRVSLVYGWQQAGSGTWLNFFSACARRLRRGEAVTAPYDQWTTPVLVGDVAAITAEVVCRDAPELLHLGGPDRISRAAWAEAVAAALGLPPSLVERVPKAGGRYASRPTYSCLTSTRLEAFLAHSGLRVRGVAEGITALLEAAGVS